MIPSLTMSDELSKAVKPKCRLEQTHETRPGIAGAAQRFKVR
jgi:hypothetical protein